MIASLRGEVIDKGLDYAVIECGGVGYHCSATSETLAGLTRGESAFVLTSLVVREDAQTLYAFVSAEERDMFGVLQKVSGVGARLAMGIMSVLSPTDIIRSVTDGDIKALQKAPGVGKRLAERMAVDLKGKLPELPTDGGQTDLTEAFAQSGNDNATHQQVVEALVGLGFTEAKAAGAVKAVATTEPGSSESLDPSAMLRNALKHLSGGKR